MTLVAAGRRFKRAAKFVNSQPGFKREEGIKEHLLVVNFSLSCYFLKLFGVKEVPSSVLVKLFLKWAVSARIAAIDAAALRQTVGPD